MNFLLLSGSFHSKSRSLVILRTINSILYDHQCHLPSLDEIPFYSEDLSSNKPDSVKELISSVQKSDGIFICTPEYNHSIPAVLKNSIDWASRPAFESPLKGKPVSIITQAVSAVGGARAQAHLKLVLDSTLSEIHLCHEMMITHIDQIVNPAMNITDVNILNRLERHVNDFVTFTTRKKHCEP